MPTWTISDLSNTDWVKTRKIIVKQGVPYEGSLVPSCLSVNHETVNSLEQLHISYVRSRENVFHFAKNIQLKHQQVIYHLLSVVNIFFFSMKFWSTLIQQRVIYILKYKFTFRAIKVWNVGLGTNHFIAELKGLVRLKHEITFNGLISLN